MRRCGALRFLAAFRSAPIRQPRLGHAAIACPSPDVIRVPTGVPTGVFTPGRPSATARRARQPGDESVDCCHPGSDAYGPPKDNVALFAVDATELAVGNIVRIDPAVAGHLVFEAATSPRPCRSPCPVRTSGKRNSLRSARVDGHVAEWRPVALRLGSRRK